MLSCLLAAASHRGDLHSSFCSAASAPTGVTTLLFDGKATCRYHEPLKWVMILR